MAVAEIIGGLLLLHLAGQRDQRSGPTEGVLSGPSSVSVNPSNPFTLANAPLYRVPRQDEELCLRYMAGYLAAIGSKDPKTGKRLMDLEILSAEIKQTSVVDAEITKFADAIVLGGNIGGKFFPGLGHAVGAAIGAFSEVVGLIIRTNDRTTQLKILGDAWSEFMRRMGPPPTGLMHYMTAMGPSLYDPRIHDWPVKLHRQFLTATKHMIANRWPVLISKPIERKELAQKVDNGITNLVGGSKSWGLWKPPSRAGWPWQYAFHGDWLFGWPEPRVKGFRNRHRNIVDEAGRNPALYFRFGDTPDHMTRFNMWKKFRIVFAVGHDPFFESSTVSTPERQWRVDLDLFPGGAPRPNWMITKP